MTPEHVRMLIPQYLAEDLTPSERQVVQAQMEANAGFKTEVEGLREIWQQLGLIEAPEPSSALRARFYQKLNATARGERKKSIWTPRLFAQLAGAAVIFSVGIGVGHFAGESKAKPTELSQLQSQVEGLRQTVALSLMDKQSASSRLEGVEWSSQVSKPDEELISALLTTLNQDQNINVRLASLDALEKFTADENVRKALEQSIPRQQSPLLQIALIDALVHIKDHSAAEEFKQLSGNDKVNAVVRQRAQWAVEKLSLN